MTDIYIVYARENREITEKLYEQLSPFWNVWWDDMIVGRYASSIKKNISETKCILAVFSSFADKPEVTEELQMGRAHTDNIIPLILDDSPAPYPFGAYSSIDFRNWQGGTEHPGFKQLQRRIESIVPPKGIPVRPSSIAEGRIQLPSLFMSVSSHETQFTPTDALTVLRIHKTQTILISAYDLVKSGKKNQMVLELKKHRANGGFILVDSGNYEAFRLGDKSWTAKHLEEALAETPHDWVFCYDKMKPKKDISKAIDEIVRAVVRDSKLTSAPVLPIIHIEQSEEGLRRLPKVVLGVSKILRPHVIAIPERELGAGLAARALTVKRIRDELNQLSYYQPIHILGTGHPWSIAVLAAAGADTFDGLEWCRFVIDPNKERIHHFQHFDFFKDNLNDVNVDSDIPYAAKVAFHNLKYYQEFGQLMRTMFTSKNVEAFVVGLTGLKSSELRKIFPEIFK